MHERAKIPTRPGGQTDSSQGALIRFSVHSARLPEAPGPWLGTFWFPHLKRGGRRSIDQRLLALAGFLQLQVFILDGVSPESVCAVGQGSWGWGRGTGRNPCPRRTATAPVLSACPAQAGGSALVVTTLNIIHAANKETKLKDRSTQSGALIKKKKKKDPDSSILPLFRTLRKVTSRLRPSIGHAHFPSSACGSGCGVLWRTDLLGAPSCRI